MLLYNIKVNTTNDKPKQVPITSLSDEEKIRINHLFGQETIASQMPIKFKTGYVFTEVNGKCQICSNNIEDKYFRGVIDRSYESTAVIQAVGVCIKCNNLTSFLFRLYGDGRFATFRNNTWNTTTMKNKTTWFSFIKKVLTFK